MTPPPIIPPTSSMPPTPTLGSASSFGDRAGSRGFFDFGFEGPRSRGSVGIGASSPYRPVSRDSSAGSQQGSNWSNLSASSIPAAPSAGSLTSSAVKSRLPRTSTAASGSRRALSRLGMAATSPVPEKTETPTHAPPSATSRSSAAVANARSRRRQTSGIEGWRQ
jgi:hypothetical protein